MSNQGYNGDLPRVVHVLHAGRRACEIQPLLLAMETTIVVSDKRLKNVLPDSYFFYILATDRYYMVHKGCIKVKKITIAQTNINFFSSIYYQP